VLSDRQFFASREKALSTASTQRRYWWVVANPQQWTFDRLFEMREDSFAYRRIQRNYDLVQPGDVVFGYQAHPDSRIVALARVTRGLHTVDGEKRIAIEAVARVRDGLTFEQMKQDPVLAESEPIRHRSQGTLFALTADQGRHLLEMLAEVDSHLPSLDDDEDRVGPLTRLTFHPSYTYEDFVEGFRPVESDTGGLSLRLVDGVFKRICRAAQAAPDRPFVLLIDEINRGNVPKVFGELITLLEADKRGLTVMLPQSSQSFHVPPNVYIIGTMNTADRSIRLLDAALRRRFAFIECMPDLDTLRGARVGELSLDTFLEGLNRRIRSKHGREKQIGHSFLLHDTGPISSPDEFARRFRLEILPLLQELAFEDFRHLVHFIGTSLVDRETHTEACDPRLFDVEAAHATLEYHRRNEHYRDAHQLAWLLLRGQALDDLFIHGKGRTQAFLIDMNRLFEDFVTRLLEVTLADRGIQVHRQVRDRSVVVDAGSGRGYSTIIPDVLLEAGLRTVPLDVKYKLYDEHPLDPKDVYQTFFYAYSCGRGGEPASARHHRLSHHRRGRCPAPHRSGCVSPSLGDRSRRGQGTGQTERAVCRRDRPPHACRVQVDGGVPFLTRP